MSQRAFLTDAAENRVLFWLSDRSNQIEILGMEISDGPH